MSFILEALKKSEKNRQENATPTLDSQHDNASSKTPKRPVWPLVLVVVLILNAGILLWLFGPWNSEEPSAPVTADVTQPSSTPPEHIAAVELVTPATPRPAVQPSAQTVATTAPIMPEPQMTSPPPSAATRPTDKPVAQSVVNTQPVADVTQPAAAQKPAPQPVLSAPEPPQPQQVQADVEPIAQPVAAPQAPARKVLALTELPGSMQQQLPRLHMSVHAFTGDQNTSLIRLNNRIMRAGSMLEDRYRLEEITSDGAIFSYQGYYFLVPRRGA